MSRSKGSESTTAAFLDEGARTQGVWLPLAMADLLAALFAVVRMWAANPKEVELPKRSEIFASWCLPMMSKALKEFEKEQDALALFNSVKNLSARQKANEGKKQ